MFNLPVSNAVSSPGAVVSQWQSNVKPTESDSALVQHTQVLHTTKKHYSNNDNGDDNEWQDSSIDVRPRRVPRQAATMAIVRASENLASEKKGERQDQKSNELASRKRQNELAVKQEAKLQPNQVVVLDGEAVLDKQRMGKCNECRSVHPFGLLEGCLTCGQVLCIKCVKTGQHSACLAYPEVARNTNLTRVVRR